MPQGFQNGISAHVKPRPRRQRGLAIALFISVLMHALIVGGFVWEPAPEAMETAEVDPIEVEIVVPPPEPEPELRLDLGEAEIDVTPPETATVLEASPIQPEEAPQPAEAESPTQEAPSAPQPASEEVEPTTPSSEGTDTSELAEAAEPPDPQAAADVPPDEAAAAPEGAADPAPAAPSAADAAPPVPVNLDIAEPDVLRGNAGSGPSSAEPADEDEPLPAEPSPTEPQTEVAISEVTEARETVEQPQAAGQTTQESDTGALETRLAGENGAPGTPQDQADTLGEADDLLITRSNAPDPSEGQEDGAEQASDEGEPTQVAIATPSPNPRRDAEASTPSPSEPVSQAPAPRSQLAFNEALRAAIDATGSQSGDGERAAQVAYTEAVRSAIAPRFWNAMRSIDVSGTAVVEVVIQRSGVVRSSRIVRSSGIGVLDSASLNAARATTYPPLPAAVQGETLTVHIPLRVR